MQNILDTLIPEKTINQLLEQSIQEAKQKLPQIKNYNVGGAFRTLLEIDALLHSELWQFLKDIIVPNMFVVSAKGKWLDLHAQTFGITRKPAQKTVGKVIFKRASKGNIKIPKGLIVKTKPDIFGESLSFTTIEEKVLTENLNQIEVMVQAQQEGSRYNVAPYAINTLTTYLPLEVYNPENWIVKEGADQETDESLRQRILEVWATKTLFTDDYYRFHVLSIPSVIDCYIDNQHPRGQGTADIYIVSTNITPTQDLINKVQAHVNQIKTPASDVLVKPAVVKPVDIHVKAYVKPNILKQPVQTQIQDRIRALFFYDKKYQQIITDYKNRMFTIGKPLRTATIIQAVMEIPQVENVELVNPQTDISLLPEEVPKLQNLTVEVL